MQRVLAYRAKDGVVEREPERGAAADAAATEADAAAAPTDERTSDLARVVDLRKQRESGCSQHTRIVAYLDEATAMRATSSETSSSAPSANSVALMPDACTVHATEQSQSTTHRYLGRSRLRQLASLVVVTSQQLLAGRALLGRLVARFAAIRSSRLH